MVADFQLRIPDEMRETILNTPALLSLLYDVDLLPEQIQTARQLACMSAIVAAYEMGRDGE